MGRISVGGVLAFLAAWTLSTSCGGSTSARSNADAGADVSIPAMGPPPYVSGTRLRAHIFDGGGGALYFLNWQDTQLDTACTFETADDGVVRCMPSGVVIGDYFADPACTQPVAAVGCGPLPPLASGVVTATGGCGAAGGGVSAFAVDATTVTSPLYSLGTGSCQPAVSPVGSTFYSVHPVPTSMFVAAHESDVPRSTRLAARVMTADDGASQVVGIFDLQRKAPCGPSTEVITAFFDMNDWCVPQGLPWAGWFTDPQCTTRVVAQPSSCPAPSIGVDVASARGSCEEGQVELFGVSARLVQPSQLFTSENLACMAQSPPAGSAFWATTGPVPLQQFPSVSLGLVGSPPVEVYFRTADNGAPVIQETGGTAGRMMRDMTRGEDCWANRFADGTWRCVPPHIELNQEHFFSDAQCSQEIADLGGPMPVPSCGAMPTIALRFSPGGTCGAGWSGVYGVGAPFTPSTVYFGGAGGPCTATATSDMFAPLSAMDPASFPTLVERTE